MVEYPVHTRPVTCSSQVAATRPVGQAVKTPPFHGGNMGSIPVRVTKRDKSELFRKSKLVRICFLLYISRLRVYWRGHATSPFFVSQNKPATGLPFSTFYPIIYIPYRNDMWCYNRRQPCYMIETNLYSVGRFWKWHRKRFWG